jgi:hypothetical protein
MMKKNKIFNFSLIIEVIFFMNFYINTSFDHSTDPPLMEMMWQGDKNYQINIVATCRECRIIYILLPMSGSFLI